MLGPPSPLFVCAPFLVTPSLSLQRTYFLNDPLGIRRSYNCILSFWLGVVRQAQNYSNKGSVISQERTSYKADFLYVVRYT